MFQQAISELPFPSMPKQIFVRNHSSSCEIIHLQMGSPLCVHFHWDQTHFHLKGFARGLVLKQRHMVTTKNGISQHPQDGLRESRRDFTRAELFCRSQLYCVHACCSRVLSFSDVKVLLYWAVLHVVQQSQFARTVHDLKHRKLGHDPRIQTHQISRLKFGAATDLFFKTSSIAPGNLLLQHVLSLCLHVSPCVCWLTLMR